MSTDPFVQFKATQREGWALFTPVETLTMPAAAKLVSYSGLRAGEKVLDVGCGTGVVAVTAARRGAHVKGLDLSPVLLERATWNASHAGVKVDFREGDAEALPYADGEFDVVLSQFGHMFAPRAEVALAEMLRVLRPGGRIAFATWPPELYTGRMFALVGRYLPPPAGVSPPPLWGDIATVRERFGAKVKALQFDRDLLTPPALSPQHFRHFMETTVGPLTKLLQVLKDDAPKLASFRAELDELIAEFFHENQVRQHFLLTRAVKA